MIFQLLSLPTFSLVTWPRQCSRVPAKVRRSDHLTIPLKSTRIQPTLAPHPTPTPFSSLALKPTKKKEWTPHHSHPTEHIPFPLYIQTSPPLTCSQSWLHHCFYLLFTLWWKVYEHSHCRLAEKFINNCNAKRWRKNCRHFSYLAAPTRSKLVRKFCWKSLSSP